jgi:hypothetical protein
VTNILSLHSDYQNLQFDDIMKYLKCLISIGVDSTSEQSQYHDIWVHLKKWLSQFNAKWYYDNLTEHVNSYYLEPSVKEGKIILSAKITTK